MESKGEVLIYQTDEGKTKIEVHMVDETVWLTQAQMADLFQRERSVITKHIKNVFAEGELDEKSNVHFLHIANSDKPVTFYNLDVIISVGYRVKSHRGTAFRIWATSVLHEYIKKGFAMDDERLMQNGNYFDELLARIRNIRSSEKIFYRKILEIYATSIDYDPRAKATQNFFKTVQNKIHFSAHGKTAAEVIHARADGEQPFMGLTSWRGYLPGKSDAKFAKNYLSEDEIRILNRIVNLYLEYAELQAENRQPMYMSDWINKLDDFLRISGRDVLTHAGLVSHEQAMKKANLEYEKFIIRTGAELSPVEKHFLEAVEETKRLERKKQTKSETKK